MNPRIAKIISRPRRRAFFQIIRLFPLAVAMMLLCPSRLHAQKLDLNSNGMSDIWEQIYGATDLDPNADTDGDGVPNRLEALAGTDPFDPNSVPKITVSTYYSDHFAVTIPSQLGKLHQLKSTQPSTADAWTTWITKPS